MEKKVPLSKAGGNVHSSVWSVGVPQKSIVYDLSVSHMIMSEQFKVNMPQKCLHTHVSCWTIHYTQDMEPVAKKWLSS